MIWGCMTLEGMGFMCKFEESPDKELYLKVLQEELCQTIDFAFNPTEVIFQLDNDIKHTAHVVREWLDRQSFTYIRDWPANSPDLNPSSTSCTVSKCVWEGMMRLRGGYMNYGPDSGRMGENHRRGVQEAHRKHATALRSGD